MSKREPAVVDGSANKKRQVYDLLKDRIIKNELKPQEFLNEQLIARDLGVSKTPVREALQKLEHERLVSIIPTKGTYVANVGIDRIREVFEIREILECAAARMAAMLPERKQFAEILENHASLRVEEGPELRQHLLSDYQLHTRIVEAVGNSFLTDYYRNILAHIVQIRLYFLSRFKEKRLRQTVEEHKIILQAIVDGDAKVAEQAMKDHLKLSLLNINQLMLGERMDL